MAYRYLTDAMVQQFLAEGYVHLPGVMDADLARQQIERVFALIDYDPTDPTTWIEPRLHLPSLTSWPVQEIAPDACAAMADLLGGEDRMRTPNWSDGFIINAHQNADSPVYPPPVDGGWHKDGDFFHHFLDSPEQGLLVFVCWSDIVDQGGSTFIAPQSPAIVARELAAHPQGYAPVELPIRNWISQCDRFEQTLAKAGDVFLLHPFMLHTASANAKRALRVITNPPVSLQEPMRFDRERFEDHSLLEQSILNALGVARFTFTPTSPRKNYTPDRVGKQSDLKQRMLARQAAQS